MLKAFSITDIGRKRLVNQDYVYVSEQPLGKLPNLFIVADGMGGHNAGDYASKYTVETIVEEVSRNDGDSAVGILRSAIETANYKVRKKAGEDAALSGMGTTVVAASCNAGKLIVANVGDSRLYVLHEGLRQVTRDHSLVEEMVRIGTISREQARNHPDKNIITRAVGADLTVGVDFFTVELEQGDVVLMCSDGLTNMLEDAEIESIIKRPEELKERALELVEAANGNGGRDNIAVILIEML